MSTISVTFLVLKKLFAIFLGSAYYYLTRSSLFFRSGVLLGYNAHLLFAYYHLSFFLFLFDALMERV